MRMFITAITLALLATAARPAEPPIRPLVLPEPREPAAAPANKATESHGIAYARIDATGTQVEVRLDLENRAEALESITFPVFALRGASPADVLERSRFLAHLGSMPLEGVVVARPPAGAPRPPPGSQIVWFQFPPPDSGSSPAGEGGRIVLQISYWQPHVGGHFHYLPRNISTASSAEGGRSWQHPLIVRSLTRLVDAPKNDVDYERMADLLVVFPREGALVAIPTQKTAGPNVRPGSAAPPAKGGPRQP